MMYITDRTSLPCDVWDFSVRLHFACTFPVLLVWPRQRVGMGCLSGISKTYPYLRDHNSLICFCRRSTRSGSISDPWCHVKRLDTSMYGAMAWLNRSFDRWVARVAAESSTVRTICFHWQIGYFVHLLDCLLTFCLISLWKIFRNIFFLVILSKRYD